MKVKIVGNIIIFLIILLALYAIIGSAVAHFGAARYVEHLEDNGATCSKHRQQSGPAHTRKVYWICDDKEIKYWHGHFWEWWSK
jgi:hypothetical protein